MGSLSDASNKLGELFIIGFNGTTLSDETAAFLSQANIGGVILFSNNYESPEQLAELVRDIQECRTDLPLWVSTDHEGGQVQRFKEPFTLLPSAKQIAKTQSPKSAFEMAQIGAKELKAVGVNLNFTPVCDILTNPENTLIADRAFGTTANEVTKMVTAIVRGNITNGIQPCVKHFPGHGDTDIDSHEHLPQIDIPFETLEEREFRPFVRTFKSRGSMLMVAHILNKAIDPDYPATLSSITLQNVLREKLRYARLIINDDMEMGAITQQFSPEEAVLHAIRAGTDLMIYRSEEGARHAYEASRRALENGELSPDRILDAANRSIQLKQNTLNSYQLPTPESAKANVGLKEHQESIENLLGS